MPRNSHDIAQQVASATGEDLSTILSRGFSMVEPDRFDFDPEPDLPPQMIDWDASYQGATIGLAEVA